MFKKPRILNREQLQPLILAKFYGLDPEMDIDWEALAIGCQAQRDKDSEHYQILIKDMYEALKAMNSGSFLDPDNPNRVWERSTPSDDAILKAYKALALAEGR